MKSTIKVITINIALLLIMYIPAEIAYRIYTKHTLERALISENFSFQASIARDTSIMDKDLGYRYKPNIHIKVTDQHFPIDYRTNSHGHIALSEYAIEKPTNEYRIGVVGDSFTANVLNTVRWSDILEKSLNASQKWKNSVHGKNTRVINFGLDGIGVMQFLPVAEKEVSKYNIDQLIVNMITIDVPRRFYFRGIIKDKGEIKSAISEDLSRVNWRAIYPELLARLFGKRLGLTRHYTRELVVKKIGRHFDDDNLSITYSANSINKIVVDYPKAKFLLHPMYEELVGKSLEPYTSLFSKFKKNINADIIDMRKYLPKIRNEEYVKWFHLPYDAHNSDLGLKVYGEAVANYLIEHTNVS